MKILLISPTGTLDNGAEVAGLNLLSHLQEQGHEIYNIFPESHDETGAFYLDRMSELGAVYAKVDNVSWWWQDAPGQLTFQEDISFAYYQTHLAKVRAFIREYQIDLVISNTVNIFLGGIAAACEKVRHFWLIHEFPFGEFAYYKDRIKLIDQLSDAVFAVEGELYSHLKGLWPSPEKLHSFIPFSIVENIDLIEGRERRIVCIGRLTERKNQLELIKGYQLLDQPDLPLIFIGGWDTEYKRKLDTYLLQNDIDNVHFMGHLTNPWQQVTNQDIFVYPSSLETYGLVYLESLLHGVPSLVSNNPGHLSVQNRFGGQTYRLGDFDDMMPKLRHMLDTFTEQRQLAQSSRQKIWSAYTIEEASRAIIASIDGVSYQPKSLKSLSLILGCDLTDFLQAKLTQQNITIYFDRGQDFNQEDIVTYDLEEQGELCLGVDKSVQRIRFDFSEQPSFISLESSGLDLNMLKTNGRPYQEGYVFLTNDPQMVITLPVDRPDSLVFSYKYQALFELDGRHVIDRLLDDQATLQHDLNQATLAYQNVVTSRRWTIPTKIIDFFRRNK